jgi:hypothetical protein
MFHPKYLRRHLKIAHPEEYEKQPMVKCHACPGLFHYAGLLRHLKIAHPEEYEKRQTENQSQVHLIN